MTTLKRFFVPMLLMLSLLLPSAGAVMAQDDDTPTIRIGSKQFTESILLGEIYAQILENDGYEVERNFSLGGSTVVHGALVNNELDLYPEYTGTALTAILGLDVPEVGGSEATPADGATAEGDMISGIAGETYRIVEEEYAEQFNVVWLDPLGLNNTYAITVRQETADELGLETISDLQGQAEDMTLGSDQEFPARPDGLPGLEAAYNLEFGDVVILDAGLMYSAVDEGQVDAITGYATDGRIPALGLAILEDDKGFFPPYHVAPVVRGELLEENEGLEELLNQLGGQIDDATMAELNRQVDEEGLTEAEVAQTFLEEQGILEGE